jgi:hypothetical protein
MTQPPSSSVPVASAPHHQILLDAGYTFESTSTTSYVDHSQTTSNYTKTPKKSAKEDMASCGPSESVSVSKDSIADEPTWRRSWTDSNGNWQDLSGSSTDGLSKAIKT